VSILPVRSFTEYQVSFIPNLLAGRAAGLHEQPWPIVNLLNLPHARYNRPSRRWNAYWFFLRDKSPLSSNRNGVAASRRIARRPALISTEMPRKAQSPRPTRFYCEFPSSIHTSQNFHHDYLLWSKSSDGTLISEDSAMIFSEDGRQDTIQITGIAAFPTFPDDHCCALDQEAYLT
jgi:hypothetical protein